VGTVTTAVEAMAVGEVEVVVTCDLLREKGRKMGGGGDGLADKCYY
jgi:hypothetical protein